jgi:hypothetical protein
MCRVGSVRVPSTTNAIERFFRAFERFDKTRQGFHSVPSAKRELVLLLVVDVFTQQATTGRAPIKVILCVRVPLRFERSLRGINRVVSGFWWVRVQTWPRPTLLGNSWWRISIAKGVSVTKGVRAYGLLSPRFSCGCLSPYLPNPVGLAHSRQAAIRNGLRLPLKRRRDEMSEHRTRR